MQIVILPTAHDVALSATEHVIEKVRGSIHPVLGLATGSTPIALYQELISRYQTGQVSFVSTTTFNLDEYIGIHEHHPQSYRSFMDHHLFDHIDIEKKQTHVPQAEHYNLSFLKNSAQRYEEAITQAGGIDLQILGLGHNGHIGFNEPTSSLVSRTRIKTLSQTTVAANKRFFQEDEYQPHLALTMGIGTILDSKSILLMATGKAKAQAVKDMIEGPISSFCPASALQQHEKTTILLDEEAASLLALKEYYRWSEEQRLMLVEGEQA